MCCYLTSDVTAKELAELFSKSDKFDYLTEKMIAKMNRYYALYEEKQLIGIITFQDSKEIHHGWKKKFTFENSICISELMVDPAYQRRGLGQQLLDKVTKDAITRGYDWLVLSTDHYDNEAAKKFYQKQGFEFQGIYTYESVGITLEVWVKKLDATNANP